MIWCNFISTTDIIILHYIVSVYNNYTLHLHIIQLIIPYRHHIVFGGPWTHSRNISTYGRYLSLFYCLYNFNGCVMG